jgi:hypothetical protein
MIACFVAMGSRMFEDIEGKWQMFCYQDVWGMRKSRSRVESCVGLRPRCDIVNLFNVIAVKIILRHTYDE